LREKKEMITGIIGINIKELLADVLGSFIVAAIAEKNVFQKRSPARENINIINILAGLLSKFGNASPSPNK
jgi:hypothetical protein